MWVYFWILSPNNNITLRHKEINCQDPPPIHLFHLSLLFRISPWSFICCLPKRKLCLMMCWEDICQTCHQPTWAGWGLHKDIALKHIAISDRCPGWQSGRCSLPNPKEPHYHNCPDCAMKMQASTTSFLDEVITAHKKKVMWFMSSQCDKVKAGAYGVWSRKGCS